MDKKYEIRALILQEFRAGRTDRQARDNICRQRGPNAVSLPTIRLWYGRFRAGDTTLRNKNEKQREQPVQIGSGIYLKANRAVLFKSEEPRLYGHFVTADGRLAFVLDPEGTDIQAVDLFHGKIRTVEHRVRNVRRHLYALPGDRLLLVTFEELHDKYDSDVSDSDSESSNPIHLYLFSFDAETCRLKLLSHLIRNARDYFGEHALVDRSDTTQFLLCARFSSVVWRGQIVGDRIVMSDAPIELQNPLCNPDLNGGIIRDVLQHANHGYLWEYDLANETATQRIQVPYVISTRNTDQHTMNSIKAYTWSDTGLYVSIREHKRGNHERSAIYRFDLTAGTWTDLKIDLVGWAFALFVDSDEFLTIHVWEDPSYTFYRFAMKKPDSLANLAWTSIRFRHNFAGSDLYERIFRRLPFNSYLRCVLPDA